MNKTNTTILTERYPWMIPIDGFGIGVGDGWFDILDTLGAMIKNGIEFENKCIRNYKENPEGWTWKPHNTEFKFPRVDQIKEKFGGLRFYASIPTGTRYELRGYIDYAEGISNRTCEDCGNKGTKNKKGWIRTLCDQCREKSERSRE